MIMAKGLRLILQDFVPPELCKELEFIHKSCCTIGYRDNVLSTTLLHLIATGCGHLVMPFVSLREKVKEKVEEFFGCEYELFVEFTGLISWTAGSKIGWHSDDNRPYLKQRHFAAVCYLNTHGKEFSGGAFHFQESEPKTILPSTGVAIIYTADDHNIHCVDEITHGERLTLTMWFTRDRSHDEDAKILGFLSDKYLSSSTIFPDPCLVSPASSSMYWFPVNVESDISLGFDVRCARAHVLGYSFCFDAKCFSATVESKDDIVELLEKPLRLVKDNSLVEREFNNSLQALQVIHFAQWKGLTVHANEADLRDFRIVGLCVGTGAGSGSALLNDQKVQEMISTRFSSHKEICNLEAPGVGMSIMTWESYVCKLQKEMLEILPLWLAYGTICSS